MGTWINMSGWKGITGLLLREALFQDVLLSLKGSRSTNKCGPVDTAYFIWKRLLMKTPSKGFKANLAAMILAMINKYLQVLKDRLGEHSPE